MPRPTVGGKLLRPRIAYLGVPAHLLDRVDERFWLGALAVQMAHEASLVHDDVIDEAAVRRGEPTEVAKNGIGQAIVVGDHLLTSAYRAAALTGSATFVMLFAEAVERTVAGEIRQAKRRGQPLTMTEYRDIVTGKTGRLFGCAFAAGQAILGDAEVADVRGLGERIGILYQMLDDFLDLCPSAETGKTPFQDYRGRTWTWPLHGLAAPCFDRSEDDLIRALFTSEEGVPPMNRAMLRFRREAEHLAADLVGSTHGGLQLGDLLRSWARHVASACTTESAVLLASARPVSKRAAVTPLTIRQSPSAGATPEARVAARARAIGDAQEWRRYFSENSRSFTFASRLFPPGPRDLVTEVYAFCRFTDDLVDERPASDKPLLDDELDAWMALFAAAYEGQKTDVPLADRVAHSMAQRGVPFHYAAELIEGVRMDLEPRPYANMAELRTYTYRVASVVGGWLTELFDRHDPWLLARAFSLGHAMQLTNILRDVGDDLRMGRVYLPEDVLAGHGLSVRDLETMSRSGVSIPAYKDLLEELMEHADREYALAFEAIPGLPPFFQKPVAVAAHVYQGIHEAIRSNGYDNLRLRARTGRVRKLVLGARALWDLRQAPEWGPTAVTAPHWLPLATMDRAES